LFVVILPTACAMIYGIWGEGVVSGHVEEEAKFGSCLQTENPA